MTKEKILAESEVDSVTLPAKAGQMTVLPGHDTMLVLLGRGPLYYRASAPGIEQSRRDFTVEGGFAELTPDSVMVYVRSAKAMGEAEGDEEEDEEVFGDVEG